MDTIQWIYTGWKILEIMNPLAAWGLAIIFIGATIGALSEMFDSNKCCCKKDA